MTETRRSRRRQASLWEDQRLTLAGAIDLTAASLACDDAARAVQKTKPGTPEYERAVVVWQKAVDRFAEIAAATPQRRRTA